LYWSNTNLEKKSEKNCFNPFKMFFKPGVSCTVWYTGPCPH